MKSRGSDRKGYSTEGGGDEDGTEREQGRSGRARVSRRDGHSIVI